MVGWIFGAFALLLLWAVFSRFRFYRRVLADAHFLALGRAAPALKQAALTRIIVSDADAVPAPDDPRILRSAAGVAIVYTVSQDAAELVHHCSVSLPGQHIAQGTLQTLLGFALRVLDLPVERARFGRAAGPVHHAEVRLSADEHAAQLARPVLDTAPANLLALRDAALRRDGLAQR
jgi:hypothetical protein